MHPRTAELLGFLDEHAAALRAAYEAIPADRRVQRPAPGRWSPAEVVQHVTIVERRLAIPVGQLVERARALPPETDASALDLRQRMSRALDRSRRITASEASQPRDADPARAWSDFEEVRRATKEMLTSADGLALGGVSAPHPVFGELDGYGWFAFVGAHVGRHAAQIREMR